MNDRFKIKRLIRFDERTGDLYCQLINDSEIATFNLHTGLFLILVPEEARAVLLQPQDAMQIPIRAVNCSLETILETTADRESKAWYPGNPSRPGGE